MRLDVPRFALLLALATASCALGRPLLASNDDLADYRAFRLAAREGTRLARARAYLTAHPDGAWAAEVRAAFEVEEPAYFEAAKATRTGARDYLIDLPDGPHEGAAIAAILAMDARVDDVETARMLRDARRTEALLERASAQRRAVGEHLVGLVLAAADPELFAGPLDAAPSAVLRALDGPARRTWGAPPSSRVDDLFFSLPAQRERESRVATVTFEVAAERGRVVDARIGGADLFVRWLEADEMAPRDIASGEARAAAALHARDVLGGALEAKMPASRCAREPSPPVMFVRSCDGLRVVATAGARAGDPDTISVRAEAR